MTIDPVGAPGSEPPPGASGMAPGIAPASSADPAQPGRLERSGAADATQDAAVPVDAVPRMLPDEVAAAIAVAAQVAERLERSGRRLHFDVDPRSGEMVVQVHDLHGTVLGTIPPSRVLELADGAELDLSHGEHDR